MPLQTLKPRISTLSATRRPVLDHKAGATPRMQGRAGVAARQRVLLRDGFACAVCGYVSRANEVDHIVPLEDGGAESDDNRQTLCRAHHAAKTALEAKRRAGG